MSRQRSFRVPAHWKAPVPPQTQAAVGWRRHLATLAIFTLAFVAMEVFSFTRESATWDEPVHLLDGYLALAHGDFRADLEHPPLQRMWAALPLRNAGVTADSPRIDQSAPADWALRDLFQFSHRFMYVQNDADRLLYPARFMIVLLGIALGAIIYAWAGALFGWTTAAALLALYAMEPNLASHARLVTTDFGVTLAIAGGVYFLWRVTAHWSPWNVLGLVGFTAMAVGVKYSGLLLAPILLVLMAYAVYQRSLSAQRAAVLTLLLAATGVGGIWAAYGFRYEPSHLPGWRFAVHTDPSVTSILPASSRLVGWVDEHHLLPNAYSEGLLLNRVRTRERKAFLAGDFSETGWWYYFPLAFLIKTPVGVILLALVGLWMPGRNRLAATAVYLIVPILIYLGSAMTTHINIGVRHILPVYPFVVMLAGAGLHQFLARGRTYLATAAIVAAVAEPALAYPHTIAFFNVLVGGPAHGSEYLVDSNVDWGQDLKGLKGWMTQHQVDRINLAYFGLADPRYYGIDCTFLPGSPGWVPQELLSAPQLPGYVAVSATILRGVYGSNERERRFYSPLASMRPAATIGHSIFVYWVDRPWY